MSEKLNPGIIHFYNAGGVIIRPGDFISGEVINRFGWTTAFFGTVKLIHTWADGTYVYFHEDTAIRLPRNEKEIVQIFRHNKRGDMVDV